MLSELMARFSRTRSIQTLGLRSPNTIPTPTEGPAPALPIVTSAGETGGISFSVDAVEPAGRLIWTETLAVSLSRRFQRKILALSEAQQPVINTQMDARRSIPILASQFSDLEARLPEPQRTAWRAAMEARSGSRCHPLIDAVHVAFSSHYPLTLSPDCIWLTIAQGFAHHVAENAETLRHRLVRHEGRRVLEALVTGTATADFEKAIAEFSAQIREQTDPVGVENAGSHRFRHTLATRLLERGASFEEIADILGNTPEIVRKHYAKWSKGRQERIDALMLGYHGQPQYSTDSETEVGSTLETVKKVVRN